MTKSTMQFKVIHLGYELPVNTFNALVISSVWKNDGIRLELKDQI